MTLILHRLRQPLEIRVDVQASLLEANERCLVNNNQSEGTFYEGAIVSGYPSDETDEAIHANIVAAGDGK